MEKTYKAAGLEKVIAVIAMQLPKGFGKKTNIILTERNRQKGKEREQRGTIIITRIMNMPTYPPFLLFLRKDMFLDGFRTFGRSYLKALIRKKRSRSFVLVLCRSFVLVLYDPKKERAGFFLFSFAAHHN